MNFGISLKTPAAKARKWRRGGFTFAEALVSTLIVGIALISIFAGITTSFDRVRGARQSSRATQVMLDKLEAMRVLSWEQLTSNTFLPTNFSAPYVKGVTNGQTFFGTFALSPLTNINGTYVDDLRQVTVTLTANWGSRRSWSMTTYYGRNGIQAYLQPR